MEIQLLKGSQIPSKVIDTDACYDITATSVKVVSDPKNGDYIQYGTGIFSIIPDGYFIDVRPRSSGRKNDLVMANSPGTIDSGYRGEWFVSFKINGINNIFGTLLSYQEAGSFVDKDNNPIEIIKEGMSSDMLFQALKISGIRMYEISERVAQVRLEKMIPTTFVHADVLTESVRGVGGHGSTGR